MLFFGLQSKLKDFLLFNFHAVDFLDSIFFPPNILRKRKVVTFKRHVGVQ